MGSCCLIVLSVDVSINSKVILFKCWFSPTVLLWCRTSEWVGLCSLVYCTSYRTLSPSIISYLLCFTTESTQEAILLVFSKPFLLPLPPFIHQREFKIQQKWPSVCIADAADELSVFWGCELFFFIVVFVSRWCFQGCHECVDIKDQMLLEFWDLFAHVGQKKKRAPNFYFFSYATKSSSICWWRSCAMIKRSGHQLSAYTWTYF